jgi:hypothetical protein
MFYKYFITEGFLYDEIFKLTITTKIIETLINIIFLLDNQYFYFNNIIII